MRVYCFKTNVCSEDYIEKILPHIHDNHKIGRLEVNRDNEAEPLLFIETDLSEETITMIVKSAGFEAVPVQIEH
jgi:hypothetical protein